MLSTLPESELKKIHNRSRMNIVSNNYSDNNQIVVNSLQELSTIFNRISNRLNDSNRMLGRIIYQSETDYREQQLEQKTKDNISSNIETLALPLFAEFKKLFKTFDNRKSSGIFSLGMGSPGVSTTPTPEGLLNLTPFKTPTSTNTVTSGVRNFLKPTTPKNITASPINIPALPATPVIPTIAATGLAVATVGSTPPGGSTNRAQQALSFFISRGWTPEQAAGIVGNLQAESGINLNTRAINRNDAGAGLHSQGIAQWNRGRFSRLQQFAQQKGTEWTDFQTQLEFVDWELNNTHTSAGQNLRNATSAEEAANIINRQYEVSADRTGKRAANARALLQTTRTTSPRVTSNFGMRVNPVTGTHQQHSGIDIAAPSGTPVTTPKTGNVVFAGTRGSYGNFIEIEHNDGTKTSYAHLSSITISNGQQVNRGQVIGAVGTTGRSTGPHLHLEYEVGGSKVDPRELFNTNPGIVGGALVPEVNSNQTVSQRNNNIVLTTNSGNRNNILTGGIYFNRQSEMPDNNLFTAVQTR